MIQIIQKKGRTKKEERFILHAGEVNIFDLDYVPNITAFNKKLNEKGYKL